MKTKYLDIRLQDNISMMREFEDNHFDIAIVDPPYGIGETWSKSRKDRFYNKGKMHDYKNKTIPEKKYFDELFRVSKNQIIWGGNYFTEYLTPTNSWIVWDKKRTDGKMSDAEMAWTSFSKPLKIARYEWNGFLKCEKIEKWHPHQKPYKLYEWLILNYAKEGDKIIDTHLGSGVIAFSVHKANQIDNKNLTLTACDIDSKYLKRSIKEIDNFTNQQILFKK